MLNLRKRIKELQEKTSSLETKQVCKEVLENFINIPDNQLALSLVEKLNKIDDADKHVEKFVKMIQKISDVTNLGVAKSLSELRTLREEIKETQIYNYPALTYNLNKIEYSLVNNKVPEYMLIDNMLETLKTFTWEPIIESIYKLLKTNREKLDESITIAKAIYTLRNLKGSFIYENIIEKLEEHFINPTQTSRNLIIEDLKKMNFTPEVRSISEDLKKLQSKNGSIQIIAENSKCEVSPVFSPIILHEGNEIFYIRGNFYSKKDNTIKKLSEQVKSLPEKYLELCRIISSPNVFIKEGKVQFFVKRNKIEISEGEKGVDVFFNGSKITTNELAKHMISAGMFRLDEAQIAYDVQKISESFKNIYELDFAKIIESKIYKGSYVILMKNGENISLTKVNESTKLNEFYTNLNTLKARNIILEFLGYDIKESFSEYIDKDQEKLNKLKETKIKLAESISIVEAQISKLESAAKEPALQNSPEVKELRKILDAEIIKLKENYRQIFNDIKILENSINESGYEVGEEVKINKTGELATISSINSSRNTLTVITASGKTEELDISEVSSLESEIIKAKKNNLKAGEKYLNPIPEEENEKKNLIEKINDFSVDKNDEDSNIEPEYIEAKISDQYDSKFAGKNVKVLANDYTSKGDEELIEVKIEDDIIFIEKKFIIINPEAILSKESDSTESKIVNLNSIEEDNDDEDDEDDEDDDNISLDNLSVDITDISDDPIEPDEKEDDEESKITEPKQKEISLNDIDNEDKSSKKDLQQKLRKTLEDLQDIKKDMKNTFTSTETISSVITSIKGMIDALRKDQLSIQ